MHRKVCPRPPVVSVALLFSAKLRPCQGLERLLFSALSQVFLFGFAPSFIGTIFSFTASLVSLNDGKFFGAWNLLSLVLVQKNRWWFKTPKGSPTCFFSS